MSSDSSPADGARLDFAGAMSYGDYLHLDAVLGAQHPRSGEHNEMLFIVQHQASELWMKLMLHELLAARARVRGDDLAPAVKMLARVARIMAQLNQSWDVLSTLTPSEYSAFRGSLGSASGFQSWQYRMIEFALGAKNAVTMAPHRHRPLARGAHHDAFDDRLAADGGAGAPAHQPSAGSEAPSAFLAAFFAGRRMMGCSP